MDIQITGKHIDIGESLKQHINDHLLTVTKKYFERTIDANVVLHKQGAFYKADISMLVGTKNGLTIKASDEADDPYVAFDHAAAKLGKQLRRYKRRLRDHHNMRTADVTAALQAQSYIVASQYEDEDDAASLEASNGNASPAVIAEMKQDIVTMAVRDAVMHMDLSDEAVYFFRNSNNGHLNAVYRRGDGNIGWIDPGLKTA